MPSAAEAIPSSGERLPAVGLGTAQVFNSNDEATRQKAAAVLQALIADGGRVVDTASTYGNAEVVLGDTIAAAGLRDKVFIATKTEEPDVAEFKRSLTRLKRAKVDLVQLHNVNDPQQSLAQFRDWKVPESLLSGNHREIERWREEQSLKLTKRRRPDLLHVKENDNESS